uniref:Guanylate cyclase domain-containing protein n=1 Tax=Peronospora matthiolae TaxID=2874970 RepID=A0AAV1V1F8_9STRA
MMWTALAVGSMALSSLATGLTMVRLRRSWDLHVSSVRWLFFYCFVYLWLWSTTRVLYLLWISFETVETSTWDYASSASTDDEVVYRRYSSMGIYTVLQLEETHDALATALLCFGDAALFAVALWMFPLTFELSNIAAKSMDRGAEKEKKQITFYAWTVHGLVLVYAAIESAFAIAHGGYTQYTQRCLLSVYFVQVFSFLYMIWLILRLKLGGRKYENVQGQFVTSPVYQRLKRIMIVYALFSLQFQIASVVMYALADNEDKLLDFISVSLLIYHLSGMALAVTTMCSQACVLNLFRPCLPDHIEAQVQTRFMQGGDLLSPRDTQVLIESAEPPLVNPVFVFTDIESSSALWAIGDGLVMQRATEIHDNILRASLMKYRGYEITTAGDAFQLAFHTVREAVEYCLDVQLQLLVANWPKELHGLLPVTRRQRLGHRLIFGGLRVRMGIHDAVDADGALILDVHAVTGKMIYTGASEVIANEIGDLGDGGQILVTKRVADWLVMYEDLVAIDFLVDRVGEYSIPQIKAKLEVYQVLPEVLSGRKKMFSSTLKKRRATTASSLYSIASSNRSRLSSNGGPIPMPEQLRRMSRPPPLVPPPEIAPVQGGLSRFGRVQRSFLRLDHGSFYTRATSM